MVPVTKREAVSVVVRKPPGKWFRLFDGTELTGDVNLSVTISEVPVFIRGGSIVPVYSNSALSTKEILATPITLHIAPDENGRAFGMLYLDDGQTHRYLSGEFVEKRFTFENGILNSTTTAPTVPALLTRMKIDRLVIYSSEGEPEVRKTAIGIAGDHTLTEEEEQRDEVEHANPRPVSEEDDSTMMSSIMGLVLLVLLLLVIASKRKVLLDKFGFKSEKYLR